MRGAALVAAVLIATGCHGNVKTSGDPDTVTDTVEEEVDVVPDTGGCLTDLDCSDGDPCTEDTCDTATGECSHADVMPDRDDDGFVDEDCGGDDCDDSDPEIHPGAEEVCNDGVDNDCDGSVDGPVVLPSDVQVTDTDSVSLSHPTTIAWAGSLYGLAWVDERDGNTEIYSARVSPEATLIGFDERISESDGESVDPSLVWNGLEFGVAWSDTRSGNPEIYFARLDPDGGRIGADIRITNNPGESMHPSLGWSGSEFAVTWDDDRDGDQEIFFVRISATGSRTGADLKLTDTVSPASHPSLLWTGSDFFVAWQDARDGDMEIYLANLSPVGDVISEHRITTAAGTSSDPSLAWSYSELALAWTDRRDSNDDIYFARVGRDGVVVDGEVRLTDDPQSDREPFLIWTGSEYGIVWAYWSGYSDCYFGRLSPEGELLEADLIVPDGTSASSYHPALAWSGSEFGMSLAEYRDFEDNVFFNRIGFCE